MMMVQGSTQVNLIQYMIFHYVHNKESGQPSFLLKYHICSLLCILVLVTITNSICEAAWLLAFENKCQGNNFYHQQEREEEGRFVLRSHWSWHHEDNEQVIFYCQKLPWPMIDTFLICYISHVCEPSMNIGFHFVAIIKKTKVDFAVLIFDWFNYRLVSNLFLQFMGCCTLVCFLLSSTPGKVEIKICWHFCLSCLSSDIS